MVVLLIIILEKNLKIFFFERVDTLLQKISNSRGHTIWQTPFFLERLAIIFSCLLKKKKKKRKSSALEQGSC